MRGLFSQAFALVCAAGAVYLASHGFSSWGWFLVAGVIVLR